MTIYNDLRLKALVRKIAREYCSDDDKILNYIMVFQNELSSTHPLIKEYMREFCPQIWRQFNYEDTKENMYKVIENMQTETEEKTDKTIKDKSLNKLLMKIKGEK